AEPDFQIVGECATVDEGVSIVRTNPVDLVLLDINLGLQQGGAFLNEARDQGYIGKVLVVTAGVSKLEAAKLLQKGCAGIFLKQESPQLLIERIRAIMADGRDAESSQFELLQRLHNAPAASTRPFTHREKQVLRGVFAGKTNKEIAYDLGIS